MHCQALVSSRRQALLLALIALIATVWVALLPSAAHAGESVAPDRQSSAAARRVRRARPGRRLTLSQREKSPRQGGRLQRVLGGRGQVYIGTG